MSNFLVGTLSRDVDCLGMGYWRGISCAGGNIDCDIVLCSVYLL